MDDGVKRIGDGTTVDEDDLQKVIRRSMEAVVGYFEENVHPDMVEATKYYNGELFGDEVEGRSKVVSQDVHDVTLGQLPDLLRIFFSGEDAVEVAPDLAEQIEEAALQTNMVNYVVREDNPGFLEFYSAFKDALVRRIGVFKWWWEEFERVKGSTHEGLDAQGVQALMLDPDVVNVDLVEVDEAGGMTVEVRRESTRGRARFQAVPPEEIFFTPDARDLDSADIVAHVREVPREEIVDLGISEEDLDDALAEDSNFRDQLEQARGLANVPDKEAMGTDSTQDRILYAEIYALVDTDGDGKAERRLFRAVGETYRLLDPEGELVDEVPFAIITPDPEPHTIIGRGNWDDQKMIQKVKSHVIRGQLDSLSLALTPKTLIQEGMVNPRDITSPEVGGLVRTLGDPNAVARELVHQFVGPAAMPLLQYFDMIREDRSGWSRGSDALDPEALQSSTQVGVTAAIGATQKRVEMIARNFAETGIRRLYAGLLGLLIKYQDQPKAIQINGEWVPVDPRHWLAPQRLKINIGIGAGTREERMTVLGMLLDKQGEMLAAGSPLVGWVEIRRTMSEILKLAGRKDVDLLIKPFGPEEQQMYEQQMAQQAQQQPQDPLVLAAQVEQAKLQASTQEAQAKLQLEAQKLQMQDAREREKIARELALKEREIELKHQADINDAELKAQVAANKASMGGGAA